MKRKKILGMVLASALAVQSVGTGTVFAAGSATDTKTTVDAAEATEAPAVTEAAEATEATETPAVTAAAEVTETPAATEAPEATETPAASSDEQSSSTATPPYDFSESIADTGYFDKIKASDYVKVADYAATEIKKADIEVTAEELQTQIDNLMGNYTTTDQVKDREVKDGDTVNIDYVGTIDGVAFDGGDTKGQGTTVTIGTTSYIPGFLDQLVGHKPGETFDLPVTFPDPYSSNTDLSGKDAVFSTTINYIQETVTPELTDDFVTQNLQPSYGYTSVENMKTTIEQNMTDSNISKKIWEDLIANSEISELPQNLVDLGNQHGVDNLNNMAASYGVSVDVLLSSGGYKTVDDFKKAYQPTSENLVKQYLIMQEIADKEKLSVTEQDIADLLGIQDITQYSDYYGIGYLKQQALLQKVTDLLMEKATII